MEQTLRIKTDDLNLSLIEDLKKRFNKINVKEFTISFSTPKKKYLYLETQDEARTRIENEINDTDPDNFISYSGEEFEQLSNVLRTMRQ